MMDMDARVSKSQQRLHQTPMDQCTLSVTRGAPDSAGRPRPRLVILGEAPYQSSDYVVLFHRWLRKALPKFKFNKRQQRWEAPIDVLPVAREKLIEDWGSVWLSDGAQEYLRDGV